LIILIILGQEHKLWSSSLCSFLQPPVPSFLFETWVYHLWCQPSCLSVNEFGFQLG
jgi:hypothetical protein